MTCSVESDVKTHINISRSEKCLYWSYHQSVLLLEENLCCNLIIFFCRSRNILSRDTGFVSSGRTGEWRHWFFDSGAVGATGFIDSENNSCPLFKARLIIISIILVI